MEPQDTSQGGADALIEKLRSEGQPVDGHFTLSAEESRRKLRAYQLADPHRYVLELIRAAVLQGASRIDIRLTAARIHMDFDGPPFSPEGLASRYDAQLKAGTAAEAEALQALAMGLNVAFQLLSTSRIRLVSGDRGDGIELRLGRDDRDRLRRRKRRIAGTSLSIHRSPASRLRELEHRVWSQDNSLTALHAYLVRRDPIATLLEQRCRYCPIPVRLNGRLLSHGLVPENCVARVAVQGPGLFGAVGYEVLQQRQPRLHLVKDGVLVATHEVDSLPAGYQAVVESQSIHLDLSHDDIVRDDAWRQALEACTQAGRESREGHDVGALPAIPSCSSAAVWPPTWPGSLRSCWWARATSSGVGGNTCSGPRASVERWWACWPQGRRRGPGWHHRPAARAQAGAKAALARRGVRGHGPHDPPRIGSPGLHPLPARRRLPLCPGHSLRGGGVRGVKPAEHLRRVSQSAPQTPGVLHPPPLPGRGAAPVPGRFRGCRLGRDGQGRHAPGRILDRREAAAGDRQAPGRKTRGPEARDGRGDRGAAETRRGPVPIVQDRDPATTRKRSPEIPTHVDL